MIGSDCEYSVNGECDTEDCECDPSGTWSCSYSECFDAGFFDSGFGSSSSGSGGGAVREHPAK
jgi:hypothetical protein